MGRFMRTVRRCALILLFLNGCLVAAEGQLGSNDPSRPRTVMGKWERVYSETGGAGFKSVFSAQMQPGKASSPRWLWLGDDKGFLRLAAFGPDSPAPLGSPSSIPAGPYFGLSKLDVLRPNAADINAGSASINAIHFDEQGDGYLLKGNRLYYTQNAGFNWSLVIEVQPLPDGTPAILSSIAATNRGACMVGMYSLPEEVKDSLVYCTEKPPMNREGWKRVPVKTQAQLFHVSFHDDRHGLIVGTHGTILRTNDGPRADGDEDRWKLVETEVEVSLLQGYFVDDRFGWIVGRNGTILRTMDGGHDWRPVSPPFAAQLVGVSLRSIRFARDKMFGWIVGEQGTILNSNDGGETWAMPQPIPRDVKFEALYVDDSYGWAVGSNGNVWRLKLGVAPPQTNPTSRPH